MSYILEALNKSEQERKGQQSPDLNTIHRAPPVKSASGVPWLLVIGLFAVFNFGALGYWFITKESASVVSKSVNTQELNTTATAIETPNFATDSIGQEPIQEIITTEPVIRENTTPIIAQNSQDLLITPQSAFASPSKDAVRITELPINVQRQVPDLIFSSHLYSSDASFRMVNINGKMIREGDMVANDLKLLEISEEGVILGYLHYVFEVSVLSDWSFN